MKRHLGRYLILILIFKSFLIAEDYFFKVKVDKKKAYQREPILLEIDFYKKEDLNNISLNFTPKDRRFNFKRIMKRVEYKNGYEIEKFKYLVFAKSKGWFKIRLKPVVIIDKSGSGLGLLKDKKIIKLKPIQLNIIQVKRGIDLVGEFNLTTSIDKSVILANEPIHLNFNFIKNITLKDINLTYNNIKNTSIYEDDLKIKKLSYKLEKLTQKIAFVSDTNFTIPSLSIKYFNPNTKKVEVTKTDEFNITVYKDNKIYENLLDKTEPKKDIKYYENKIIKYFPYFAIFIFGFLIGKFFSIKLPKFKIKKITLYDGIKEAKNPKELIKILIPYVNYNGILEHIKTLEDKNLKFKKVKKEILRDFKLKF